MEPRQSGPDNEQKQSIHKINLEESDLYKVLDIGRDSTLEEIKKAYRRLALIYHPDKKPHGNEAVFKKINQAYCALSDLGLRKQYDASGGDERNTFTETASFRKKYKEKYDDLFFSAFWERDHEQKIKEYLSKHKNDKSEIGQMFLKEAQRN
jgi:DnaJ-class molecular chaperone